MTIPELMQAAMDQAKEKGWHDPMASFTEDLCLVHSEISEALEAYRERDFEAWHEEDGKPCGVASELADAMIRIAEIAAKHTISLDNAIKEKMAYNRTRSFRHGGKKL